MGRWGDFMKASTHLSGVGVDIAAVECDCAPADIDATSALPDKQGTSAKASTPTGHWGDGVVSWCRKPSTYTLRAHKGATHSTSVKASTPTGRWGGLMKASAYCSLVVVDIAIVQCDSGAPDEDATSVLPNNEGTSVRASTPSGRWDGFML